LWLELGNLSVGLEHRDERLLDVLTAVPLPQHPSPADSPCSTVRLFPCTPAEVRDRAEQAAECLDPVIAGDGTYGLPPIHAYIGPDGVTMTLADIGFARVDPDWREVRIGLVVEQADTLAGQALGALVLQDLAAHFGYFAVHASMAERTGDGVLFCGDRARGKSTSCLAMGRGGWTVRGDDRCYVRAEPLAVWGPAGDMRLCADAADIWGDLRASLDRGTPWGGKRRVPLAELVADSAPGFVQPKALFFPQVTGQQRHGVTPLAPAEALEELLCATGVASLPAHTATHFAAVADLVEAAPSYRLRLGPDMSALPALIEETIG